MELTRLQRNSILHDMLPEMILSLSPIYQLFFAFSLALLVWRLWLVIFRLYFHPLAKFRGPRLGRVTSLYMMWEILSFRATYTRHSLHQIYGPIVRVGPNELSFSNKSAIKDIYGQGSQPCLKPPQFYAGFTLTGSHSVFSCVDRVEHAKLRRLLAHAFSERGVLQVEGEISKKIQRFIAVLRRSENPVDLYEHLHNLLLDLTSQLSFSKSFDLLEGAKNPLADDIHAFYGIATLFGLVPWTQYIPFGPFKAAAIARRRLTKNLYSLVSTEGEKLKDGSAPPSILRSMMEARDKETGIGLSNKDLVENAGVFIEAGSGTTASSLVYLIYELARHSEIQKRVVEEIRQAFPDLSIFPTYEKANKLPYLSQVIREVMRLNGPLSTFIPRLSPGKTIAGVYIPAGVIVGCQTYTTGRDENVFPGPLEFNPDRWENPTEQMQAMDRPFSSGPRVCIGMHVARVEMLITACAFYQAFDVELIPGFRHEGMELDDQGFMMAKGKSLLVKLTPVP